MKHNPCSLYHASVSQIAKSLHLYCQKELVVQTTERMKFDLLMELYGQERYSLLAQHLGKWEEGFLPILTLGEKRTELHTIFQRVIDVGYPLNNILADVIVDRDSIHQCSRIILNSDSKWDS
jgi:hypothetical protein